MDATALNAASPDTSATAGPGTGIPLQYPVPAGVFDEVFGPGGQPRPQWEPFLKAAGKGSAADLQRRSDQAARLIEENGITYNVFTEGASIQRPWRLDLLPVIFGHDEWQVLAAGLRQRMQLLELIVQDIYGPQRLLKDGVLPSAAVFAHPGFLRPFHGLHVAGETSLVFSGTELARSGDGRWWVMADRTEAPAGPAFALENRITASRTMPPWMNRSSVLRLAPFFIELQETLRSLAERPIDNPRIVLLTSGPKHPYYFEDVYLARYLGYTLVEGGDLAVRDERVYLKTLAGLVPVDVIFSRAMESGIDPLELGGGASHGVPGLLQALRRRHVRVANLPGCGLVESPIFMAFLPAICRKLLGDDLKLPSIATWWCGEAASRQYVREHLDELVVKPAFHASGSVEYVGSQLSSAERDDLKRRIAQRPYDYVAQELVRRSAAPVWENGRVRCGHVALRTFSVSSRRGFHLMPGGLVRMAKTTDPIELSIAAGDGSKDLWVMAEGPVDVVTLLEPSDRPLPLRRTGALFSSRVADDLFWLGQAIDRADFLGRLLRTVCERLTSEKVSTVTELSVLVRALADAGQIEPGFALAEMNAQLPALELSLPRSVLDVSEARGLASAVSEMVRLCSLVRDWLSPDTWRMLHRAGANFMEVPGDSADLLDALTAVNRLILDLAAASGLIQDGMIRGPAWRFLEMGRQIERARNVARLILSSLTTGRTADPQVIKAMLEVVDCRMTYRARYLDNYQQNALLDLCVTDETNPRSVAYQVIALAEHVDTLPHDLSMPLRTEEKRLVMAAVHAVRMLTPEQLAARTPHELRGTLENLEHQLKALSEMLTRKYLLHSGVPRQITEEVGLP